MDLRVLAKLAKIGHWEVDKKPGRVGSSELQFCPPST